MAAGPRPGFVVTVVGIGCAVPGMSSDYEYLTKRDNESWKDSERSLAVCYEILVFFTARCLSQTD